MDFFVSLFVIFVVGGLIKAGKMKAINRIIEQAKKKPARIVLCEADDPRVLQAASLVTLEGGIANVTLVGKRQSIEQLAKDSAVSLEHIELVDPDESPLTAPFADLLFDLRGSERHDTGSSPSGSA